MKRSMSVWHKWLSPLVIGVLVLQASAGHAQGIRKIVDDKGVTFYTNEPPENDPPSKGRTTVPAVAVSAASDASTAGSTLRATSVSKPSQTAASAPATLLINPAQALGDWPPKSMQFPPAKVPP